MAGILVDRLVAGAGLGALLALAASSAQSTEGVFEINQTLAVAGNVTPGDAPGFPVTLSTAGSFVLTGNLSVSDLDATALLITAPNGVTVDLNGFRIIGPCPQPSGCSTGAGTGHGIDASASSGVEVKDGRIRYFAGNGIAAGSGARLSELMVSGNGGTGIVVSANSEVRDVQSHDNAGTGIAASGAIVRDSTISRNLDGMVIGENSLIEGNTVDSNGRIGILVNGGGTTVRGNAVSLNSTDGIAASVPGTLVVENVTNSNTSAGIALLASGSALRNVSTQNALGLYLVPEFGGNPAAYRGNFVHSNTVSSVTNGINMGENSCNGTPTCP